MSPGCLWPCQRFWRWCCQDKTCGRVAFLAPLLEELSRTKLFVVHHRVLQCEHKKTTLPVLERAFNFVSCRKCLFLSTGNDLRTECKNGAKGS